MSHQLLRLLCVVGLSGGCAAEVEPPRTEDTSEMRVGESRVVDVQFLRFDVDGFEKTNTLDQLAAMPRPVLDGVWLLDLDARPLMVNAVSQLQTLTDEEVAALPLAGQNMHRLLTMTPDNALLEGTNLEELIGLSAGVGIPPAKTLANLFGIGVTDPLIPPETVVEVMLDNLVATHPAAQQRMGPIDEAHPDGLYAVEPGRLPVTLADVVTNFENMAERFGPAEPHPGFLVEAYGVSVVEEAFAMISKVTANALPYKGVDLTNATSASVNSVASQIDTIHNFADPDWIRLEGMVDNPTVETLTFRLLENPEYIPGGTSRMPPGQGDSPAWDLPPYEFERLMVTIVREHAKTIPAHCDSYELATGVEAFTACIADDGWVTLETFNNVGAPPAPAYLWDLDLEISQVRIHDGGIAEGDANAQLTVHDVEVGVPPEQMIEQMRQNVQANPAALREFASLLTNSSAGEADFYYYRSEDGGDWLYFVGEGDIPLAQDGSRVRPYGYGSPGFFADRALATKVSDLREVDGDTEHEKVAVAPGDSFYLSDDDGRVYQVDVGTKPSRAHLLLRLTRIR